MPSPLPPRTVVPTPETEDEETGEPAGNRGLKPMLMLMLRGLGVWWGVEKAGLELDASAKEDERCWCCWVEPLALLLLLPAPLPITAAMLLLLSLAKGDSGLECAGACCWGIERPPWMGEGTEGGTTPPWGWDGGWLCCTRAMGMVLCPGDTSRYRGRSLSIAASASTAPILCLGSALIMLITRAANSRG